MDEEIRAKVHELIEFCEAKGASLRRRHLP